MIREKITNPEILLLEKLCNSFGPMGCEDDTAALIRSEIKENALCDRIVTDINGNVFAWVYANADTEHTDKVHTLICAHMDEVGFMVTHIDDSGYVHFGAVGGIDMRVLCSRRVVLGNENPESRVPGIICSKPVHLLSESERSVPTAIDKMYIDIGAKNREEAEKLLGKGDFGTFAPNFTAEVIDGWDEGRIVSKAIDDRIGCAVMLNVMKRMKSEGVRPKNDVCFAFTVGEEGGIKGAQAASYRTCPEYSIILESTTAADLPDIDETRRVVILGEGGALSIADNGTLYDRDYVRSIMDTAVQHGIKCQYKKFISGGNDSSAVQKAASGVKVAALSAPTRYLHTATTVANAADYYAMNELVYTVLV